MSKSEYTIRHYEETDFEAFSKAFKEDIRIESPVDRLKRPGISPESNLFVAEYQKEMIGYALAEPELSINRVILHCWVQPDHRRKGVARELVNRVINRAEELNVQAVHVDISSNNSIARNELPKLGFKYVRRYLELFLDIEKIPDKELEKARKECRQLFPGEEQMLADIQNRAFADHWGYHPNTPETIAYDISLSHRSPQDIVVTCEENSINGYCWTEIIDLELSSGTEKHGIIYMIGTDPEYRGKGLGKKVLLAGLSYLKNKGIKTVSLSVDSENRVAYELYRTMGFEERGSTLWYEKKLR
ncbi:MAG: GNAT family N-acetyltransferase [Dehalococcoidales bacterium]|nr:MAG: GNAT family N-acetyltransferase [Dehalococcoidales bacterium]